MDRKEFLGEFLGALGVIEITWTEVYENFIAGIAHFEPATHLPYYDTEEDDQQDFCWHKSDKELPGIALFRLVTLINRNRLLKSDKIKVTRSQLNSLYNGVFNCSISSEEFDNLVDTLKHIEVSMVDDGIETDIFFIHE